MWRRGRVRTPARRAACSASDPGGVELKVNDVCLVALGCPSALSPVALHGESRKVAVYVLRPEGAQRRGGSQGPRAFPR